MLRILVKTMWGDHKHRYIRALAALLSYEGHTRMASLCERHISTHKMSGGVHMRSNDQDQQLAASRLSIPSDSAASLLHRLVRGAVGFPSTRSLGHRRERFRPVVKSGRIKVSAIRPNEGVDLWI